MYSNGFNRNAVHTVAIATHNPWVDNVWEVSHRAVAHDALEKCGMRGAEKLRRAVLEKGLVVSGWHTVGGVAFGYAGADYLGSHIAIGRKNVWSVGLPFKSRSPTNVIPVKPDNGWVIVAAV